MPDLLTIPEVAERLATTERHIRRLIADDRIPYRKIGRLIRFDASELDAWLEDNAHGAPTRSRFTDRLVELARSAPPLDEQERRRLAPVLLALVSPDEEAADA